MTGRWDIDPPEESAEDERRREDAEEVARIEAHERPADEDDQPTEAELEQAWKTSMAFNAEAARSGLFHAAMDIADVMKKSNVPDGEACLMTGAVEFAVQLWFQVTANAGVHPNRARDTLMKEVWDFWDKHRRLNEDGGATEVVKQ